MQRKYKAPGPLTAVAAVIKGQARILLLDIETAPILANVWSTWKVNVGLNMIKSDWYMLSFAAKWLGSDKMIYHDQSKAPDIEDDSAMLAKLHVLLDQADIVIAHNGRKFDVRKINARFFAAGMLPPSPYKIIDTLEISRRNFAFTSHKLEYLADKFNTEYKKLTNHGAYPGFELWKAVIRGDKKAWAEMRLYNEHDVLALEELYMKLRVWDDKHPNIDVHSTNELPACPVCGGTHLHKRGSYFTNTGEFQRYQCASGTCGAWSRTRYTMNAPAKRKALLTK